MVTWVCQSSQTKEEVREDPRYVRLGIDLDEHRSNLAEGRDDLDLWLDVDLAEVTEALRIAEPSIRVQTFDLV